MNKQMNLTMALLLAGALPAAAGNVYTTRFESPAFAAGSTLVGQDGWVQGPPFLSPNAAVISTARPRQGKQSVSVWGGDLDHQDILGEMTGGYYDAIGSYRRPVDFDTEGTQIVRISAHVRIDGPQTDAGINFFSASIAARALLDDGNTAGVGELTISSDGNVYGYSGNDNVPAFLTSAPVTLGEWHDLAVEVGFGARTFTFSMDGQSLGTFDFVAVPDSENPGVTYTNILRRGSIITYAAADSGGLSKADYSAHYDRFTITADAE